MSLKPLEVSNGLAWPLGATAVRDGFNFALMVMNAQEVELHLFQKGTIRPLKKIKLNPSVHKTANVWHIHVSGLSSGDLYIYKINKLPVDKKEKHYLIDPYAKAHYSGPVWGDAPKIPLTSRDKVIRLCVLTEEFYHWVSDNPLNTPLNKTIIYEAHVRGFTKDASSKVKHPGTFAGLVEKIPYLKRLGITAVELMPVFDFDENGIQRKNPQSGELLKNYWGYDPISFFALKNTFAHDSEPIAALNEFHKTVKALHKAGIEVILDVVFNHSAEGGKNGPVYNFKGLANDVFYLLDMQHNYSNYSGCGNTLSCNHPVVSDMIIKALRYWAKEMQVDGFRFDLASILCRGKDGLPLKNPPLIEQISSDPVLANCKLIAEPWDAGGLYQLGSFPGGKSWLEWNGKFRDDIRRFIKGDDNLIPTLAKRLYGSSDLYQQSGRSPLNSVNFISCHDGFPLADLVQYSSKHNLANGEDNKDGENYNHSSNWGVEGPTADADIYRIRDRQIKNMAALLMLARGVPMFLAGDEFGRTQQGNNNAYCQDNAISWIDWTLLDKNRDRFRFFQKMIAFRKKQNILTADSYMVESRNKKSSVSWHGSEINKADWSGASKILALLYSPLPAGRQDIFIMINGSAQDETFQLPGPVKGRKWKRFMDTYCEAPLDIADNGKEFSIDNQKKYLLHNKSIAVLLR